MARPEHRRLRPIEAATYLQCLVHLIDDAYDQTSWHGPNLRGSLRGLTIEAATYRPHPDRHNIWEQVLHAAYWKYIARRRFTSEKRGSFSLKGSNWFSRPAAIADLEQAWSDDLAILDHQHQQLREAIAAFPPERLPEQPKGSKVSYDRLIRGVAMHDVYHAGQIQLLKRLSEQA